MKDEMDFGTEDAAPKAGMNLSGILAKLRSKYPELADEPLMDQLQAKAETPAGDEGPSEDAFGADEHMPVELDVEAPAEEAPKAKAKRKRPKMSEMPAPDLSGVDIPEELNGSY